ncbi:MAG: hypothetical protein RLZZ387_3199, partial [Chloroflexota bacterium]
LHLCVSPGESAQMVAEDWGLVKFSPITPSGGGQHLDYQKQALAGCELQ